MAIELDTKIEQIDVCQHILHRIYSGNLTQLLEYSLEMFNEKEHAAFEPVKSVIDQLYSLVVENKISKDEYNKHIDTYELCHDPLHMEEVQKIIGDHHWHNA